MMKKRTITLTLLSLILYCFLFTTPLTAEGPFTLDFNSRYIWRGFDLNPNNHPVIQPSLSFPLGDTGFSIDLWGSFSFEDKEGYETDITLTYELTQSENLSLSIGLIHYGWYFSQDFTFKDDTTQEIFISLALPKLPLSPTLSLYYDFTNGSGLYALCEISHDILLSNHITLKLNSSLGYNEGQWIEGSGFSDVVLSVSLPLHIGNISLTPFLGTVFILLDEVNPGVNNEIYMGLSLNF